MAWLWALLALGSALGHAEPDIYPKGTNLASLWVIADGAMPTDAQKTLVTTLQGLVASRSSEQIYVDGGAGYSIWKNHLHSAYGITLHTVTTPWQLVTRFKGLVAGYILYDRTANLHSISAATSLSGLLNAVAVDSSIETQVRAAGLTNRLADVRTRDAAWAWTNYPGQFNRGVLIEQRETLSEHLRDYAAMSGSFAFFDGNSPFRTKMISSLASDAVTLGWGDASQGENVFVGEGSRHGSYTIAADYALNLSTLSSIRDPAISQKTYNTPTTQTNVHYVTFVITDGDNVQWNLGGFPGFFNNPARGTFDMGWAVSPSLAELAPSTLRWYYDNSSSSPHHDFFVAGPSGSGYFYPSMYPTAALGLHVHKLGRLMNGADLNIAQILDFGSFNRLDLWNQYFSQPNIDSLFYLEYAPYDGAHGAMLFSTNGNPVIAARDMIWPGLEDPAQLIRNINSYSRDVSSPEAYTMVSVLVWNQTQSTIQQVVTNLLPDVRVVTPDAFVKLVRNNVGRHLTFDFSTGLQGWTGTLSGLPYDRAQWSATAGHPGGALLLDGSDLGHPDANPNAWLSRQVTLPLNALALRFETAAVNDGQLRVRLVRPDGNSVTLLNWEKLPKANTWVTRSASLTPYAGQTVTLYFDQNDGGQGAGEFRYIDNVTIQTTSAPLYPPKPPRLLDISTGESVNLAWRDNDVNESGFKIERSIAPTGAWTEIAQVPTSASTYSDPTAAGSTHYAYRLRSWNPGASSPYSNTREITTPPRPRITVQAAPTSLLLRWPVWATNFTLYSSGNQGLGSTWIPVPSGFLSNLDNSLGAEVPLGTTNRFFQLRSP